MPEVDFKGGQIAYDVSGKGSAVIFLHGFLENKSIWKSYSKALSSTYKVISIDLPGHGSSSNLGYCHSMELMGEAAMTILKSLNIRRFFLIGHSLGGYVAMALAEKFPDEIKGLCLFHSTSDNDSPQKKKERQKVIKVVQKDKNILIRESIPNLFNTTHKPYKQGIKTISKMAKSMSSQAIIASLEGMKIRPNREIVIKFAPYPVLYIIGKEDKILPYIKLIEESNMCENSEYLLVEKCGHMGFIENPAVCLNAIKKLIKRSKI